MTADEKKYNAALKYARLKHEGQFRIGGLPYITHPVAVAQIVRSKGGDTDAQITALFHDLLEDTDASEEDILRLGNRHILSCVKLLTKTKGYVMADYVADIKSDKTARLVKGADRLHNLRSAVCADNEFKRRYILETVDWYLDLDREIPAAVKALAESMDKPLAELPFLYEPIDTWKI
ncbi:MAG: HD domain-containing protein [Firmicutes bacterium]|nr:HD domain-containing protein [Bacillota bacterium]